MACEMDLLVAWFHDRGYIVELHEGTFSYRYETRCRVGEREAHGWGDTVLAATQDLRESALHLEDMADDADHPDPETRAEAGERRWEEQRDRELDAAMVTTSAEGRD